MKDVEIETLNREVAVWEDYRNHGQHEHSKTVQLLEQEIADMEKSFTEISGKNKLYRQRFCVGRMQGCENSQNACTTTAATTQP